MHEEKDYQRGLADGDGKRRDGVPFAQVNERDTCGKGGQRDQRNEN
jgi:hypothetical protein